MEILWHTQLMVLINAVAVATTSGLVSNAITVDSYWNLVYTLALISASLPSLIAVATVPNTTQTSKDATNASLQTKIASTKYQTAHQTSVKASAHASATVTGAAEPAIPAILL